jgi:hypothetical protein
MFCLSALACSPTGFTVGENLNALTTPDMNADGTYKRFAVSGEADRHIYCCGTFMLLDR